MDKSYRSQRTTLQIWLWQRFCVKLLQLIIRSTMLKKMPKKSILQRLLNITEAEAVALLEQAMLKAKESVSLYDFTSRLRKLEQETRFELIRAMWNVAYADGCIDPIEESVIRKTADLLYVGHSEFIRAKIQVMEATGSQTVGKPLSNSSQSCNHLK